jgi:hypothetical protein
MPALSMSLNEINSTFILLNTAWVPWVFFQPVKFRNFLRSAQDFGRWHCSFWDGRNNRKRLKNNRKEAFRSRGGFHASTFSEIVPIEPPVVIENGTNEPQLQIEPAVVQQMIEDGTNEPQLQIEPVVQPMIEDGTNEPQLQIEPPVEQLDTLSTIDQKYRGMKLFVKCGPCQINLQNNLPIPASCATNTDQ